MSELPDDLVGVVTIRWTARDRLVPVLPSWRCAVMESGVIMQNVVAVNVHMESNLPIWAEVTVLTGKLSEDGVWLMETSSYLVDEMQVG